MRPRDFPDLHAWLVISAPYPTAIVAGVLPTAYPAAVTDPPRGEDGAARPRAVRARGTGSDVDPVWEPSAGGERVRLRALHTFPTMPPTCLKCRGLRSAPRSSRRVGLPDEPHQHPRRRHRRRRPRALPRSASPSARASSGWIPTPRPDDFEWDDLFTRLGSPEPATTGSGSARPLPFDRIGTRWSRDREDTLMWDRTPRTATASGPIFQVHRGAFALPAATTSQYVCANAGSLRADQISAVRAADFAVLGPASGRA